jgi:glycine/D-amino acid oxidase-like deaminating enzyme
MDKTNKATVPTPLQQNIEVDVCIVGAGIAGLTSAYLLGKEGKRVAVLDGKDVGGGETGRTTAHLSNALDDRYFNIESVFGEEGSRLAAQSHVAAIDRIEAIVREERIDCDFERVDGYLFTSTGKDTATLDQELVAARIAGLGRKRRLGISPRYGIE